MNRIFEFIPSPEEAVVSRTLMLVHQAMDQHLPSASKANRQFTKTILSDDGERTAALLAAPDEDTAGRPQAGAFGSFEETSPDGRVTPTDETGDGTADQPTKPQPIASTLTDAAKPTPVATKKPAGEPKSTGFSTLQAGAMPRDHKSRAPDWVTRITLVFLLVGLVLLAYVIAA
jgi:hypothetical protein